MAEAAKKKETPTRRYRSGGSGTAPAFDQRLTDAVRAGLGGDAAGMRQLLDRLIRADIPDDRKPLRDALALAAAQTHTPFIPFRTDGNDVWASYVGPQLLDERPVAPPPAAISRRELGVLPDSLTAQPPPSDPEPLLYPIAADELRRVVDEHRRADRLAAAGVHPTRTLLLTGAPGTGKTHTARWLCGAIGRPLLTLDLARLVAHELGRSARNLQAALAAAARADAILLIDELDAVGKARSDIADVGEMKRLVNVLLLEFDRWPAGRLLVAATNHPDLLDSAVARRFERRVDLPLPDADTRRRLLDRFAPGLDATSDGVDVRELVVAVTNGWTGSDLQTAALQARRDAALSDTQHAPALVEAVVRARGPLAPADRRAAIRSLAAAGLSNRRIAALLGVTHPTVGKVAAGTRQPRPRKRDAAG